MRDQIITVVASAYCQPIADLVEGLVRRPRGQVVAARIGERENGYSLSIVLLLVVMLEAYVGRVNDLQLRRGPKGITMKMKTSIPDYLVSLRRSFRLHKSLTEVFVLRDAIAHAHVWTLDVSGHRTHGMILRSANLGNSYGDKKHCAVVNPTTRRTRSLGLNVVPSAVGRREVEKVFDVVHRVLTFLIRSKLLEPNVISYHGRFRGRPFDFWELKKILKETP